jgi:hypothetical protein
MSARRSLIRLAVRRLAKEQQWIGKTTIYLEANLPTSMGCAVLAV